MFTPLLLILISIKNPIFQVEKRLTFSHFQKKGVKTSGGGVKNFFFLKIWNLSFNLHQKSLKIFKTRLDSRIWSLRKRGQKTRFLAAFQKKGGLPLIMWLSGGFLSIALGLAKAQPNRKVYCLDGDGAALMHLGGFASNFSLNESMKQFRIIQYA